MKDWISKLEKEKNLKDIKSKEKAEKIRKEEAAFALVKEKLRPEIRSTITALRSRAGIILVLDEHKKKIEVTKRDDTYKDLVNPHKFIISVTTQGVCI